MKALCKKGILKNFAIFIGKQLSWSIFPGLQVCNLLLRDTNTHVFLQILQNSKEHHFQMTASYFMSKNQNNLSIKNLNQWKSMGF